MPRRLLQTTMQLTATMFIAASLGGCAYVEERFADVTEDPMFQVGFRPGEVYRLRADASLVATISNGCLPGKAEERLEIWSSDSVARYQSQNYELDVVTAVKAGSLIRVDGLEHNYTFAIPPVPGDAQVLQAYGTVVDGSMVWTHVTMPDDRQAGWSEVKGTHVMAYPPDATLLERLPADAWPANARPTVEQPESATLAKPIPVPPEMQRRDIREPNPYSHTEGH